MRQALIFVQASDLFSFVVVSSSKFMFVPKMSAAFVLACDVSTCTIGKELL